MRTVFLIFLISFLSKGYSQEITQQEIPERFKIITDSLTQAAPLTYAEINTTLRKSKGDTVLMRYFADISRKKGYLDGQTYALNELGRKYRNKTQYTKAIALHQRALEIAEEANNIEFRISSLNNIGVVYRRTSSIRAAMDYNQRALEMADTIKKPSEGIKRQINISLNSIGNLYQTLKQYDAAIEYFDRAVISEGKLRNTLGLAINHQNIGECYEEQGNFDEAMEKYLLSLSYNEEIDNNMGRVICNNSMAQIHLKRDHPKEAIKLLESVLPLALEMGNGFLTSPVYANLGWAHMLTGNYKLAEENMKQGLKIAEKVTLRDQAAKTCHLLSQLSRLKQEYRKALDYNIKAERLDEEILNEGTVRYVNDVLYKFDSDKRINEFEILNNERELYKLEVREKNTVLLVSGITLALLAGIFYILYRQYQLKNDKKLLTLEQSMLRSQMNPHFLFNSLNSIKLYIINNEKKNAVHYLNKFSKLIRKILEASSLKEIPLADELETVELYMNIENIRFSNEIDFNILIDEKIDTQLIKIPSLILQPFLENALWHGLSPKEGQKRIDLHISRSEEGYIQITITDNGIGRVAAEKIKENKVLKRKSVGIAITKERLANFSRDYQNYFDVEILDLYSKDHKSEGTKVVLRIPTV